MKIQHIRKHESLVSLRGKCRGRQDDQNWTTIYKKSGVNHLHGKLVLHQSIIFLLLGNNGSMSVTIHQGRDIPDRSRGGASSCQVTNIKVDNREKCRSQSSTF